MVKIQYRTVSIISTSPLKGLHREKSPWIILPWPGTETEAKSFVDVLKSSFPKTEWEVVGK